MKFLLSFFLCTVLCLISFAQEPLNIWMVAHSHDDTGWLRTIDEYYVYEVQYILDSVVEALLLNPERKFIEVEMAFFSRWWREQTPERKEQVKMLTERGQLEFINGGWCMNDEAVATYYAMIDQMTLGHEFLQEAIGDNAKPTIGWHIDPFGHSNVVSSLYKMVGFDAFFINRIDYRVKDDLRYTQDLEFWWEGSKSIGKDSRMWIHMMDRNYCTPEGFNWEHGVTQDLPSGDGPPPIVNDPPSWNFPNNAIERATAFIEEAKKRAREYKTNNILIPFGCDFTFQNANMMFKNMDKLIQTINDNSAQLGATARYTSLSDYAEAVKSTNTSWITRTEDFYPYADNGASYWTGYFTSRPVLKSTSRRAHSILRASDTAFGLARILYGINDMSIWDDLFDLRSPEAVVQHHDGVTGTFRKLVGENYMELLEHGIEKGESVLSQSIGTLVSLNSFDPSLTLNVEFLQSQLAQGLKVPVVVHNSLGWELEEYISVPIVSPNVLVTGYKGEQVNFQVNPKIDGTSGYTLYFYAKIPAAGHQSFFIQPSSTSMNLGTIVEDVDEIVIENEYLSVTFDNQTGFLTKYFNKQLQQETQITQSYWNYQSYSSPQSSGAYIFRPTGKATLLSSSAKNTYVTGPYVQHVHQVFQITKVLQDVKVFKGLSKLYGGHIDIISTVGPLSPNQEVSIRFSTDISNDNVFYTDNNGLEMQRRVNLPDGRPGDYDLGVQIAGNFYPAVSRVALTNGSKQIVVASQSTHAAASLQNGQVELLLHRRCSRDDSRGMNEPLDDITTYVAKLKLNVDSPSESASFHQRATKVLAFTPTTLFARASSPTFSLPTFLPLSTLPENIHVVSLNPRSHLHEEVVVRLLHTFEVGEHPTLSQSVSVNLINLFSGFKVVGATEMTLTLLNALSPQPSDFSNIQMNPMQIRTFLVKVQSF